MILGYAIAKSRLFEQLVSPYLVATQAIPVVAIAPLLVIWFGPGIFSKVLICALIVFFPVLVNTVVGVRAVPRPFHDLMQSLHATRPQTLRMLELPASLPVLLGGLRIGATLSVIGAVVGELVGSDRGLGFLVNVGTRAVRYCPGLCGSLHPDRSGAGAVWSGFIFGKEIAHLAGTVRSLIWFFPRLCTGVCMKKYLGCHRSLVLLSACGQKSTPTLTHIKLSLGYIPDIQFAPLYVAAQKGYFADAGIEIEFAYQDETQATASGGREYTPIRRGFRRTGAARPRPGTARGLRGCLVPAVPGLGGLHGRPGDFHSR